MPIFNAFLGKTISLLEHCVPALNLDTPECDLRLPAKRSDFANVDGRITDLRLLEFDSEDIFVGRKCRVR